MVPRSLNSLVAEGIRAQLKLGHPESPAKSPCKTGASFLMWLLLTYICFEHHMLHLNKAKYIYIVKVYSLTNHLFYMVYFSSKDCFLKLINVISLEQF